jgi:hypothetical protein
VPEDHGWAARTAPLRGEGDDALRRLEHPQGHARYPAQKPHVDRQQLAAKRLGGDARARGELDGRVEWGAAAAMESEATVRATSDLATQTTSDLVARMTSDLAARMTSDLVARMASDLAARLVRESTSAARTIGHVDLVAQIINASDSAARTNQASDVASQIVRGPDSAAQNAKDSDAAAQGAAEHAASSARPAKEVGDEDYPTARSLHRIAIVLERLVEMFVSRSQRMVSGVV